MEFVVSGRLQRWEVFVQSAAILPKNTALEYLLLGLTDYMSKETKLSLLKTT